MKIKANRKMNRIFLSPSSDESAIAVFPLKIDELIHRLKEAKTWLLEVPGETKDF